METIFITIHDLSLDARIKYCSDSIEEILGYKPYEVRGKSCWEYFHPDEIPFARAIHGRGLDLEKAAALNYCRIKHKNGSWIGSECVFTVVYDVLVASTSIYQVGSRSQRRAAQGEAVRRVFSSSPRDPRYHMLSYISNKFTQSIPAQVREPRAALVINRFSRMAPIMFATNGVEQILGFTAAQLKGKCFYSCIAENCLSEAIRCIESAKGNDSIAYLRFFFRDPTLPDLPLIQYGGSDSDESEDGGVAISRGSSVSMNTPPAFPNSENVPETAVESPRANGTEGPRNGQGRPLTQDVDGDASQSRDSSGTSSSMDRSSSEQIFDRPIGHARSSASSLTPMDAPSTPGELELEAVVSCTSDGLVIVLRRASSMEPTSATEDSPTYPNGLFASPWALEPVMPDSLRQTTAIPNITYPPVSEPTESGLMSAIRDVAVFAWSLTGINGSLVDKAKGTPKGEAIPPGGLPIWDPNAPPGQNDHHNGFSGGTHRRIKGMGEDTLIRKTDEDLASNTSSDDEVLWKRAPQMPSIKRPKRRAHQDAFGIVEDDSTDNGGVQVQDRRRRKLENGDRHNST